jgi:hypothetical protein
LATTAFEMNLKLVTAIKRSKRLYQRLGLSTPRDRFQQPNDFDYTGQAASDYIKDSLSRRQPCMICRFGFTELECVLTHLHIVESRSLVSKYVDFLRDRRGHFWWDEAITGPISELSGFFPTMESFLDRFAQLMLRDCRHIDVLGSWLQSERQIQSYYPQAKIVQLTDLEPYFHANPWSEVLAGKKVLVIHPFSASIESQYRKRKHLFQDQRVLPEFELITLRAVQSIANNVVPFGNWFQALESMCRQIGEIDFDVAIIGAGAYGFPLAAFIKQNGRQAIHLGGAVQILFGIKGSRWDNHPVISKLYNEHWARPLSAETPAQYKKVEQGCYW